MRQIAISDTGIGSYGFPWRNNSTCFNFKFPKEAVHPDDIDKITDRSDIDALVIDCDLSNYSFISDMTNLTHLYIYSGDLQKKVKGQSEDFIKFSQWQNRHNKDTAEKKFF